MLIFLLSMADEQYQSHIERLFKRYHQQMMRVARKRFVRAERNNPSLDAEDAVQSAFLCIVRYAHVVPFGKPERELKAYVFAILQNEISKILEESELPSENELVDYRDEESLQEFGERIHNQERYNEVVAEIRDMDPRYSTVLLLCYAEGMTVEQVAKLLSVPQSTVYTRLRRGKQQLIEKLAKEDAP